MLCFTQIFERLRIVQLPASPLLHWKTVVEASKSVPTLSKNDSLHTCAGRITHTRWVTAIIQRWTQW